MTTQTKAKTHSVTRTRKGKDTIEVGTLEELTAYYQNTLANAASWNEGKINLNPRTINSLISNLNKAVSILQKGSYDPNHYELTAQ